MPGEQSETNNQDGEHGGQAPVAPTWTPQTFSVGDLQVLQYLLEDLQTSTEVSRSQEATAAIVPDHEQARLSQENEQLRERNGPSPASPGMDDSKSCVALSAVGPGEELVRTMLQNFRVKVARNKGYAKSILEVSMSPLAATIKNMTTSLGPEDAAAMETNLQDVAAAQHGTSCLNSAIRADQGQASDADEVSPDTDLDYLEQCLKGMESTFQCLAGRVHGGIRTAILAARFIEGVRRLQGCADTVEAARGLMPLSSDYPPAATTSTLRTLSSPAAINTTISEVLAGYSPHMTAMEVINDAIGTKCGNYHPAGSRLGEPGDTLLSGTKRVICENMSCATRRHKVTVRADAERVCDWILSSDAEDMLPMVWVQLEGIEEIKFTGFDIRARILNQNSLDIEMADALVCLLREHEAETLFFRKNNPGRHYVGPNWAVTVLNGATCCPDISYNQFMFPTPRYDIRRCQIVLTLVCQKGEWYCYAFDMARSIVSIMDPLLRPPIPPSRIEMHTQYANKLVTHVVCCMRLATGNKTLCSGTWTPKLMLGRGRAANFVNSGIEAINCMRWYNGNIVCTPPKDRFAINTRKDLTLQLISMSSNVATTPVLRFALGTKKETQGRQRKKTRHDIGEPAMRNNSSSSRAPGDGNSSESSTK